MIYVASDIHGNYDRYEKLLNKINLTEKDALIILGDILDRGDDGIKIMLDVMQRDNIFTILGNHEQIALACLETLNQEITEESINSLQEDTIEMLLNPIHEF